MNILYRAVVGVKVGLYGSIVWNWLGAASALAGLFWEIIAMPTGSVVYTAVMSLIFLLLFLGNGVIIYNRVYKRLHK